MLIEWRKQLEGWLHGPYRYRWLAIIGIGGILLIGLSSCFGNNPTGVVPKTTCDAASYAAALEERLCEMISAIEGAGRAEVMVTLNNGVEYVYANEEKNNTDHSENGEQISVRDDNQKTVVTVDAGSGKEGLLITEIQPTVRGVVVACEGANDEAVALRVAAAVRTALDITEKRVCVIPYNTEKG